MNTASHTSSSSSFQNSNSLPSSCNEFEHLQSEHNSPSSNELNQNSYSRRRSLQEDIIILQEEKSRQIKLMMDSRFREKIREQLNEELDRRVREALETPPLEKMSRATEKVVERQVISSRAVNLCNDVRILSHTGKRTLPLPLREIAMFSKYSDSSSSLPNCSSTNEERFHLNDDVPFHLTTRERNWLREHKKRFNLNTGDFPILSSPTKTKLHELRLAELQQQQQERMQQFTASQMELASGNGNTVESDSYSSDTEEQSSNETNPNPNPPIDNNESAHMAQARALRFSEFNDICDPNGFRIGMEAMENFASLTLREKEVLFSNFTLFGFRDILRTGRLPDGTKTTEIRPGVYRDVYGIERDKHGPFWPKERGPLHPRQTHLRYHCPSVEPLVDKLNQDEKVNASSHHSNKYNGVWKGMQIVFDSEKSPRTQKPSESRDGLCPNLIFESRFESGNLRQARRVGQFEYELILSTDLFTNRHTQWFYFRVSNMQSDVTYKFIIINLLKKSSLYNEGMLPLFYSTKLAQTSQLGWHRKGHHVSYTRNNTRTQSGLLQREVIYYQLKWELEFPVAGDTCYFAHCYPYTFSDLRDDITWLMEDALRQKYIRKEILCETRAGNGCFLLTITQPSDKTDNICISPETQKQGVVVTARVHPGETNASWMMRGLLDFLTSEDPHAEAVRRNFIFKIIPMLNPDGVIVGNYRCSLAARDLNRNYRNPRMESFPTIWHTKRMIAELQSQRKVLLYCDLHGHSRKHNVFMYGCDSQYRRMESTNSYLPSVPTTGVREFMLGRLFPWIMAKHSPEQFSFPGCKFHIHKCKESTGRVVVWRQMNIDNSFTMEATFSGTTIKKDGIKRHFNMKDLENVGSSFVTAIKACEELRKDKKLENEEILEMARFLFRKVMTASLQKNGMNSRLVHFFSHFSKNENSKRQSNEKGMDSSQQTNPSGGFDMSSVNEDSMNTFLDSLTVDSLDDTMQLLDECKVDILKESDSESSDSDSESEPEEILQSETISKRKKKKKSKKMGTSKNSVTLSKLKQLSGGGNGKENLTKNQPLPTINPDNSSKKRNSLTLSSSASTQLITSCENKIKKIKLQPLFTNRYEGRHNGGIPCFSEERLQERANKRFMALQEKQRQEDEEFFQYMSFLVDDSPDNNFLRRQFNVLLNNPVLPNESVSHNSKLLEDAILRKRGQPSTNYSLSLKGCPSFDGCHYSSMYDLFNSPNETNYQPQLHSSSDSYGFGKLPSLGLTENLCNMKTHPLRYFNKISFPMNLRASPFPDDV